MSKSTNPHTVHWNLGVEEGTDSEEGLIYLPEDIFTSDSPEVSIYINFLQLNGDTHPSNQYSFPSTYSSQL
jgi:hypothetical protein